MINFQRPYLLVLIILALGFTIYLGIKKIKGSKFKKSVLITLRSIVFTIIILSLCGTEIKTIADNTTTIFAVDLSASIAGEKDRVTAKLKELEENQKPGDKIGIVTFGKNAMVEASPTDDIIIDGFKALLDESQTDIGQALGISQSVMEENTKKRIVLISDGLETKGDAISQGKVLAGEGVQVWATELKNTNKKEVQLTSLTVPEYVNKGTEYNIELQIDSLLDTTATLKLYKGGNLIVNKDIEVAEGENKLMFTDISDVGGGVIYRAVIEPKEDTVYENNTAFGYSYVDDIPSVLIIKNTDETTEIKRILDASNIRTVEVKPESVPTSIDRLNIYDGVIMVNTPAARLAEGFADILETYVKTLGGGFMVAGGEDSYGLGGYKGTVLEKILPVDMDLKTEGENPNLGMVMVIDHSGSMSDGNYGLTRMELAKEAAIRGLDSLEPEDKVGVLAFDNNATWIADMTLLEGNKESLADKISKIQPVGGTSILPALQAAYDKLKDTDTKIKHIILLTDGEAEKEGYDGLLASMQANGITLSSVAVGSGADTRLLERLANQGGGRYYFSNEFTDLPEIFAKETFLAGKDYINERDFYPQVGDNNEILTGIEALGQVGGYIGTSAKPRADVVLLTDKQEPLLASWQYGLGRSVAWTSDLQGRWSGEFLSTKEGAGTIRNAVSWLIASDINRDVKVTGEIEEGKGKITIKTDNEGYNGDLSVNVVAWDGKEYTVEAEATAPGVYEGYFDDTRQGAYIVNIGVADKDGNQKAIGTGFNLPYSKEFNISIGNEGYELLREITTLTGGKIVESFDEAMGAEANPTVATKDISLILLIFGLILFLIDVALRRFSFILVEVENALAKFKKEEKPKDKKKDEKAIKKEEVKEETAKKSEKAEDAKEQTASTLLSGKRKRR